MCNMTVSQEPVSGPSAGKRSAWQAPTLQVIDLTITLGGGENPHEDEAGRLLGSP